MKWVDTHSPPIQPKRGGEVKYHLALSSVPGLTNFVQLVFTALCVQQLSLVLLVQFWLKEEV